MARALASIRKIEEIEEIENADKIELAIIDGWQCVVKKGEFVEGDLCVYFEIDSILPAAPWSEFMRDRKFRVRTIKLRGCLSQGLALPIHAFGMDDVPREGQDVTERLGVRKHDPEAEAEKKQASQKPKKKLPWWANNPLGRKIFYFLYPKRGGWPEFLPKTDETRVQNIRHIEEMLKGRELYYTEKLDGQSLTYYVNRKVNTSFFKEGSKGVCSRNIHYPEFVSNNWWNIVESEGMLEDLERFCYSGCRSLAIQGELVGPDIQGNKYGLKERRFYGFNVYDLEKERYLNLFEKLEVFGILGIHSVPFVCAEECVHSKEYFLDIATGWSLINSDVMREGIVVRDVKDDSLSFKAISNAWLLHYKD